MHEQVQLVCAWLWSSSGCWGWFLQAPGPGSSSCHGNPFPPQPWLWFFFLRQILSLKLCPSKIGVQPQPSQKTPACTWGRWRKHRIASSERSFCHWGCSRHPRSGLILHLFQTSWILPWSDHLNLILKSWYSHVHEVKAPLSWRAGNINELLISPNFSLTLHSHRFWARGCWQQLGHPKKTMSRSKFGGIFSCCSITCWIEKKKINHQRSSRTCRVSSRDFPECPLGRCNFPGGNSTRWRDFQLEMNSGREQGHVTKGVCAGFLERIWAQSSSSLGVHQNSSKKILEGNLSSPAKDL